MIQKPGGQWDTGKKLEVFSRKGKTPSPNNWFLLLFWFFFSWFVMPVVTWLWLLDVLHSLGSIFLFKNGTVYETGFPKDLQLYLLIIHSEMDILNYEHLAKSEAYRKDILDHLVQLTGNARLFTTGHPLWFCINKSQWIHPLLLRNCLTG